MDQHQESGLEGVLGFMFIAQQPAAHAQDYRPVPLQEHLERVLVVAADKVPQQGGVR